MPLSLLLAPDGQNTASGSGLRTIQSASSAFPPVSRLFHRRADPLSPGLRIGCPWRHRRFSIHCAPHSFQSSDHLCRRWRCRYPLWVRPWCPWGWSTRKKCHVQSEAQSAVAGMSDPARRGAGHHRGDQGGCRHRHLQPGGDHPGGEHPFPGPDGIWCRRTDWAAPQPALSEGLGGVR